MDVPPRKGRGNTLMVIEDSNKKDGPAKKIAGGDPQMQQHAPASPQMGSGEKIFEATSPTEQEDHKHNPNRRPYYTD